MKMRERGVLLSLLAGLFTARQAAKAKVESAFRVAWITGLRRPATMELGDAMIWWWLLFDMTRELVFTKDQRIWKKTRYSYLKFRS